MPTIHPVRGLLLAVTLVVVMPCAARADALAPIRAAAQAQPVPSTLPREAFLANPTLREVKLAPDGRQIAFLRDDGKRRSLWLQPLDADAPRRVLAQVDADALIWSRDSRWLFLVSDTRLAVFAADGQGRAGLVARLGQRRLHEVIGSDPSRAAAVLVLEHSLPDAVQSQSRLLRIDAHGMQTELHADTRPLGDAALSADGRVLYLRRIEADHHAIVRLHMGQQPVELARCIDLERCQFLGVSDRGDGLWLNTDLNGNFSRLQHLSADGTLTESHVDPRGEADLDGIVADPVDGTPLLASYRATHPRLSGLTAESTRELERLQARLPDRDLDVQVGRGSAAHWLVAERDSTLPQPRWHVYDPRSDALRSVLESADDPAQPDAALLVRKWPIAWTASDGMRLHGFLSLPAGRDPGSVPLVVSVHGGPWSASTPGYSAVTQFLANRGFAVFEPNFRGSTGHGRAYLFAAKGDFGNGRVLQDIIDGTRHLLDSGIGDPARVAIEGASFGGYAALLGATFHPELYRVAIAGVPPTDFGWALRWAVARSDLRDQLGTPLATRFRLLAVDPGNATAMASLRTQSPLANAGLLDRPVLLFAGGRDERVAIRSVTHYAATLRQLGKAVELHVEAAGDHGLDAPLSREGWLYLLEATLHQHVGGPPASPPSASLRGWLQRTRRP